MKNTKMPRYNNAIKITKYVKPAVFTGLILFVAMRITGFTNAIFVRHAFVFLLAIAIGAMIPHLENIVIYFVNKYRMEKRQKNFKGDLSDIECYKEEVKFQDEKTYRNALLHDIVFWIIVFALIFTFQGFNVISVGLAYGILLHLLADGFGAAGISFMWLINKRNIHFLRTYRKQKHFTLYDKHEDDAVKIFLTVYTILFVALVVVMIFYKPEIYGWLWEHYRGLIIRGGI